ncbi:galectin-2-like [Echinops telfairi]|nr:galectin-2-like [Echinops telfairi]
MEINLGQSADKLNLHFNLGFPDSVIVCNSKNGGWGEEQRISCSAHWVKVTVSSKNKEPWIDANFEITYEKQQFTVKLPDRYEVTFPNRLGCDPLRYLSTKGNFRVSSVTFD